jgi:hypothetical protein
MPSWAIYGNERRRGLLLSDSGAAVQQFLNRIAAQDGTHTTAYTDLINGLVADGIWDKIQALYVFAAAEAATALTNLKSESFAASTAGTPPTFTADVGYVGTAASETHIKTGYNNATHGTQNDQHIMFWNNTTDVANIAAMGCHVVASDSLTNIYPKYDTNKHYARVNAGAGGDGVAVASPLGMILGSRDTGAHSDLYFNGAAVGEIADVSDTPCNLEIYILGQNEDGTAIGSNWQCRAASLGLGLTATQAGAYYTHLNAYMAAIDA